MVKQPRSEEARQRHCAYNRARYAAKRGEIIAKRKAFELANPETVRKWQRDAHMKRRDVASAMAKARYNNDPAFRQQKIDSARAWALKNPEKNAEHQAASRKRRKETIVDYSREYYQANKSEANARGKAVEARKRGALVRQPCSQCGSTRNVDAHHDDYTKPLDVRWLCRSCHRKHHVEHGTHRISPVRSPEATPAPTATLGAIQAKAS